MYSKKSVEVTILTIDEVLPVRHEVLWPSKPLAFCRVEDDETGEHYGVKLDGDVVCVASVFLKSGDARLRKFATRAKYQGKGVGSLVLKYLIQHYKERGASLFWLDARETAVNFYERFGFSVEGPRFYKSEVPYFKVVKSLV